MGHGASMGPFWRAALGALSGCAILSPLPDTRTPVDRAHDLEPRCRGYADPNGRQILSPEVIDAVEPWYAHVRAGPMDPEARLRGARLRVRPLPGFTKESIARTIECHEVAVTLGSAPALEDDPYFVARRWLEIDVSSEGDAFVVGVEADKIHDAQIVLERAKRFAARKNAPR